MEGLAFRMNRLLLDASRGGLALVRMGPGCQEVAEEAGHGGAVCPMTIVCSGAAFVPPSPAVSFFRLP